MDANYTQPTVFLRQTTLDNSAALQFGRISILFGLMAKASKDSRSVIGLGGGVWQDRGTWVKHTHIQHISLYRKAVIPGLCRSIKVSTSPSSQSPLKGRWDLHGTVSVFCQSHLPHLDVVWYPHHSPEGGPALWQSPFHPLLY